MFCSNHRGATSVVVGGSSCYLSLATSSRDRTSSGVLIVYLQPVLTLYSGSIAYIILYAMSQNQFHVM